MDYNWAQNNETICSDYRYIFIQEILLTQFAYTKHSDFFSFHISTAIGFFILMNLM